MAGGLLLVRVSLREDLLLVDDGLSGDLAGHFLVFGLPELKVVHLIGVVPADAEAWLLADWIM
jgi:hypothetical protein